jgi:hypothetical protein
MNADVSPSSWSFLVLLDALALYPSAETSVGGNDIGDEAQAPDVS